MADSVAGVAAAALRRNARSPLVNHVGNRSSHAITSGQYVVDLNVGEPLIDVFIIRLL